MEEKMTFTECRHNFTKVWKVSFQAYASDLSYATYPANKVFQQL